MTKVSPRVTGFTRVPNAQDADDAGLGLETVEGQIPARASGNHELPKVYFDWAAELGVPPEHLDALEDSQRGYGSRLGVSAQEIAQPLEVSERLGRVDYLRQRIGFGLRAVLPLTLSWIYLCTAFME